MGFKDNWLKEDEKCNHCGAVTKRQRGITRQNMRRLLVPQNNSTEWMITFLIIMVLFIAWRFQVETTSCRAVVSNITDVCFELGKVQSSQLNTYQGIARANSSLNLSELNLSSNGALQVIRLK